MLGRATRPWCRLLAATLFALVTASSALAQGWPARPIRLVVNFPPGGVADQLARMIAQPLQEAVGQPVVVENRAGANGNIGGEAVAKSSPDGHTLLMSSGGMVSVNPHIYPKMPFDPEKDLVPVAAAARVAVYLVVRPGRPAGVESVQDFIAHLKANPGRLSYGSPGNGSSPHLATEMFKQQLGVFAVHVAYRGAAPALTDLLSGQLDFVFDPGVAFAHVKAGRLKMLAVGSLKRSPLFPDVPTLDEIGLKGFDADSVFGVYGPAGMPPEVIERLNREINRILQSPAVRERVTALGGDVLPMTPAEFRARALDDSRRFGAIIRDRKILAD